MDLVWLVCLRPMGCHLLNFFEISGREFRSSAAKLRPKGIHIYIAAGGVCASYNIISHALP